MTSRILLVSSNETLQATRALVLRKAGYLVIERVYPAGDFIQDSTSCDMAILGHSLLELEQERIAMQLFETNPSIIVLRLQLGLLDPSPLLKIITDCFASATDEVRDFVLEPPTVVGLPTRSPAGNTA